MRVCSFFSAMGCFAAAVGWIGLFSGCGARQAGEDANARGDSSTSERSAMKETPEGIARLSVTSPAFTQGETIPKRHTADGEDLSPELKWDGVPASAKSLAVICDDPDAPGGTWVHWVIYNISTDAGGLGEGILREAEPKAPAGAKQGLNSWPKGNVGYRGPSPPPGKPHHYHFKVFTLDTALDVPPKKATRQAVVAAMEGHVVGQGELVGIYER